MRSIGYNNIQYTANNVKSFPSYVSPEGGVDLRLLYSPQRCRHQLTLHTGIMQDRVVCLSYGPAFAGTKLYCLVTEAHGCEQLASRGCYLTARRPGLELATSE